MFDRGHRLLQNLPWSRSNAEAHARADATPVAQPVHAVLVQPARREDLRFEPPMRGGRHASERQLRAVDAHRAAVRLSRILSDLRARRLLQEPFGRFHRHHCER